MISTELSVDPTAGSPLEVVRQPVRFGPVGRQMVGIYHFPRPSAPHGTAALLCNPFGQEAIRSHRVFAVLADRLAQHGVPVLRFDYHGTGDSPGDDDVGEMDGWATDILAAQDKLDALARPGRRVWIGLRLGALLCAVASRSARVPPDMLVFWDPIVDGAAYLQELVRADRVSRLGAFSLDPVKHRSLARSPLPMVPTEVLGFVVPAALSRQLMNTSAEVLGEANCARIALAMPGPQEPEWLADLRSIRASDDGISLHRLDDAIDWATNDAGGSTIAPAQTVGLIVPIVLEAIR